MASLLDEQLWYRKGEKGELFGSRVQAGDYITCVQKKVMCPEKGYHLDFLGWGL